MLLRVVVEGHLGVEGRIDPAAVQQLKGLVQVIDRRDGRAVLLGQLGIGAGDRVCGRLAVQILQRLDVVIVRPGDDSRAVVGVGGGEIVFCGAVGGDVNAVDHNVIAPGVKTGQQAVPLALNKLRLHAELFGDFGADLDIVAHKGIALIVVGPGRPGALHCDGDGAAGLDLAQQVGGGGIGRRCRAGGCCSRAAAGSQRSGQGGGQGQGGQLVQVFHYKRLLCL